MMVFTWNDWDGNIYFSLFIILKSDAALHCGIRYIFQESFVLMRDTYQCQWCNIYTAGPFFLSYWILQKYILCRYDIFWTHTEKLKIGLIFGKNNLPCKWWAKQIFSNKAMICNLIIRSYLDEVRIDMNFMLLVIIYKSMCILLINEYDFIVHLSAEL